MGYVSDAQRKAVHASKADGGKGNPNKMISPLKRKGCGPQSLGSPLKKKGPCWEGYEMVGMKKKGGRTVPNCVPLKMKYDSPLDKHCV